MSNNVLGIISGSTEIIRLPFSKEYDGVFLKILHAG
jgi:hypothetical protein